ncbi:MAG: hypothetical protein IJ197_09820 [Bacteroidaceae bacterium]|nr:hypothetical protein [Bacteroidaceae bacterium]
MKKFLLLLCTLLVGVGAWADVTYTVSNPVQVTDIANLSADKFYVLQSAGGSNLYNYYDAENSAMSSKADYDYSAVVRLIYDGTNVQIQQVCTSGYYQTLANGARVTLGENAADYAISSAGDGKFFLDNNNLKLNTNNTGNLPQGANSSWTGAFSQWMIFQVDVTTTWTSADNWEYSSGGKANVNYFGILAPGTTNDHFELSSFSVFTLSDGGQTRYAAIASDNPNSTATVAESIVLGVSSNTVTASTEGYQEFTLSSPVTITGGVTYYIVFLSSNEATDGNYTQGQLRCGLYSTTYAPKTYWNTSGTDAWAAGLTATLSKAIASSISVTYELYESDGTTLVSSVVKPQDPESAINIPSTLNALTYYTYTTEGTIGNEDCTIKVIRTLKEGVVINVSGFSNNKCYTISTKDRGSWVVPSGATQVTSTTKASLAFSKTDVKQQFAFINYEDHYYLYSVSESKFISKSGQYTTLTAEPGDNVTLLASQGSNSHPVVVALQDGAYHAGISNGYNPAVITSWKSLTDDGNRALIEEADAFDPTAALAALEEYFHPSYTITYVVKDVNNNTLFTSDPVGTTLGANVTTLPTEYQRSVFYSYNTVDITISEQSTTIEFTATPKEDAPVKYTVDTSNPYYYNLNIRSKYLVYNASATGEVTLQDTSEPFNADASWAFIGEPYAGFKVINKTKGTGYDLTYTSVITGGNSGGDGSNNNVQFVADENFGNRYWLIDTNTGGIVLRMKENTSIYFHHQNISGSNGYLRTCSVSEWSAVHNDAGSTIVAATDEDVLVALYNEMKNFVFGDAIGQYSIEGTTAAEANAVIAYAGQVIDEETTSMYAEAYEALKSMQAAMTLNTPAAGFYRVKNVATGKYLTAISAQGYNSTTKGVFANGNATSAATVIQLVEKTDGLYMYNQGDGFGWVAANYGSGNVWVTPSPDKYIHWFPGNAAGQIGFAICLGNGTGDYASYLMQGIFTTDSEEAVVAGTDYTVDAAQWIFEEATEASVALNKVGDEYYATLCVPFDVTLAGAEAYTLTVNEDKTELDLGEALTEVTAGTPVMLKGTSATATATIGSNYVTVPIESTLTGVFYATTVAAETDYFLGVSEGEVGFYKWTGTTLKANRAYLPASAVSSEVKGLKLNLGDADAIHGVEAEQEQGAIYNLAGQRVSKAVKGIYIINGRKVVVK